ncbi:MAG TPA: LLM class flavin-dependent oxidoreductase [Ktedonobacteraceae bacterium]
MQAAQQDQHVIHPWVQEGLQQLRAGVGFLDTGIDWHRTTEYAQAAEELGYDSIWVPDHPLLMPDCWAHLAALAAVTHKIRLGPLVNCIFYRSPLALARSASDIDRWSQGRLVLGLGIGDFGFEFAQLGIPFRRVRERQDALEEVVQILKGVWSGSPFAFAGNSFQIQQVEIAFGPVQQPHIPLLIAGGGERVTLRQVAQYADASNFGPAAEIGSAFTLDDVLRKNEVIATYCQTFGRPSTAILRTHSMIPLLLGKTQAEAAAKLDLLPPPLRSMMEPTAMIATVETAIDVYRALARSGMQYFIIVLVPGDIETLQLFKEQVLPAAAT